MERFETLLCVILLFCPFKSVLTLPVEPVCSKFAYEEQLLEKMVRIEFFVENMQKDVQKSISNVMDVMNGIKEKNVEITDNLSELHERTEKVESKTENIVDKIQRNSSETEEIKASETPAVAFNTREAVEYSGTDTVVFSTVILNEGKAYNDKTGFFTAPIDGIYQFNAHLCFVREIEVDYYLKVGGRSIASGEYKVPQQASDAKCTSFSAVALVRKDEKVHVGGMTFKNLDQSDNDWNSFSGVLIQTV